MDHESSEEQLLGSCKRNCFYGREMLFFPVRGRDSVEHQELSVDTSQDPLAHLVLERVHRLKSLDTIRKNE